MKKGKSYRSLYLPAWSIVAAVLTLLMIIAVSTYRNMSRETGRMEESLIREGLVIIRAIEAGVRADAPATPPDPQRLQKLVEEVSREPEIAAVLIHKLRIQILIGCARRHIDVVGAGVIDIVLD